MELYGKSGIIFLSEVQEINVGGCGDHSLHKCSWPIVTLWSSPVKLSYFRPSLFSSALAVKLSVTSLTRRHFRGACPYSRKLFAFPTLSPPSPFPPSSGEFQTVGKIHPKIFTFFFVSHSCVRGVFHFFYQNKTIYCFWFSRTAKKIQSFAIFIYIRKFKVLENFINLNYA